MLNKKELSEIKDRANSGDDATCGIVKKLVNTLEFTIGFIRSIVTKKACPTWCPTGGQCQSCAAREFLAEFEGEK